MSERNIAVVTGTRAEYGLLYWTMRELQALGIEPQLIVTGAHLSPDHGMTVERIEADGWNIAARVDIRLSSDTPLDIACSTGLALSGIAEALDRLRPDLVVILGDRYEMLAAASAAALLQIPIAHIQGGEVSGAIDESMRHAITKLSYWHFASAEPYAKRLRQLGEEPARIFTTGAPGIDNIARLPLLTRPELEKELGLTLTPPVILFTYHPETLSERSPAQQIETATRALAAFPEATLLITGANADSGGRAINQALEMFAASRPHTLLRLSLGSLLYLSAMRQCDVVAGNSSSGVIEAPAMGKAAVNIGTRQVGRLRAESVIDCRDEEGDIVQALRRALSPAFQKQLKPTTLFGVPGQVAAAIAGTLASLPLPPTPRKHFRDL